MASEKRQRRYVVIEYVTAWSEWIVEASNKAEAVQKAKDGDVLGEGVSGNDGPSGRYDVRRDDDA